MVDEYGMIDGTHYCVKSETEQPCVCQGKSGAATGVVTVLTQIERQTKDHFQYKKRDLTYTNGILTTIGTESDWIIVDLS